MRKTDIQTCMHQVARMKLRFRTQRLDTLRRVTQRLKQPDKEFSTKRSPGIHPHAILRQRYKLIAVCTSCTNV